ncbi:hypothetical protein CK203_037457 [Vitis vinifera]|uniref:Uncharacterized protein n=1 Tax=Vitis vinifera TaxID=29760 RepID=A0A438HE96_VITVI|nr:hypothetical protein CK203_037457 [Vitis vinifera]
MAKVFALFLLALLAISMLHTTVLASHGHGGHHYDQKNYGPGSLKSFPFVLLWCEMTRMPVTVLEEVRQDTVPQALHVLLSEMLQKVPVRSPRYLGVFGKSRMTQVMDHDAMESLHWEFDIGGEKLPWGRVEASMVGETWENLWPVRKGEMQTLIIAEGSS